MGWVTGWVTGWVDEAHSAAVIAWDLDRLAIHGVKKLIHLLSFEELPNHYPKNPGPARGSGADYGSSESNYYGTLSYTDGYAELGSGQLGLPAGNDTEALSK
jgi:hypothetical protein